MNTVAPIPTPVVVQFRGRNTLKIDVPDSDWSESGTSVGRSRGLRFRGRETAPHTEVSCTSFLTFLSEGNKNPRLGEVGDKQ